MTEPTFVEKCNQDVKTRYRNENSYISWSTVPDYDSDVNMNIVREPEGDNTDYIVPEYDSDDGTKPVQKN